MEIKGELWAIRASRDSDAGLLLAQEFATEYRDTYPSLVSCPVEALTASLTHLKLPFSYRQYVRTTYLMEGSLKEERRRTKRIPGSIPSSQPLSWSSRYGSGQPNEGRK